MGERGGGEKGEMACSDFAGGEIACGRRGDIYCIRETGIKYRTLNTVFSKAKRPFLCLFVTEERGKRRGGFRINIIAINIQFQTFLHDKLLPKMKK